MDSLSLAKPHHVSESADHVACTFTYRETRSFVHLYLEMWIWNGISTQLLNVCPVPRFVSVPERARGYPSKPALAGPDLSPLPCPLNSYLVETLSVHRW